MGLGFNGIDQSISNSARTVSELARERAESSRADAKAKQESIDREDKMVAGAEASIAQIDILKEQNGLLADNYSKLKEMYDAQVEANKEAKEELKRSRRFNLAMMIIAFLAMLATIASPIVTILVSRYASLQ